MPPPSSIATERRLQAWGGVLWPSFLVACLATLLLFAFVDPLQLARAGAPGHAPSRELACTLGFFAVWAITAASSALTLCLVRPRAPADDDEPLG